MRGILLAAFCLVGTLIASPAYSQSDDEALLILSVPPHPAMNRDYFRRVDLEGGRFIGRPVLYTVDTMGSIDPFTPRNQINTDNRGRLVALATRDMPPGDYVWLSSYRTIGNFARGAQSALCHSEVAPVFRFAPGTTTIVRTDHIAFHLITSSVAELRTHTMVTDAQVLEEFQQTRTRRPELNSNTQIARPVAWIRWDVRSPDYGAIECNRAATFQIVEQPAETTPKLAIP